ncbi:MAG: TonB-dependent receptor plug domain-containing protein, partial [Gammaproteobacteria bacterium]|nr:TonB-dependent receptor plug domain-containing protein [Gammaproteobacteria bacterium]
MHCKFSSCLLISLLIVITPGFAQEDADISVNNNNDQDGVVTYDADFFRRYQPNTALDMAARVPGFNLDDGGDTQVFGADVRGYGGAAGNILINDRRPSAKQDSPTAILSRISAETVDRIELIRVKVRDIDLLGQTEVINVILKEGAAASVRWESYLRVNTDYGLTPFGSISMSDSWSGIEYNVGMDYRNTEYGDPGVIDRFDPDGTLIEIRDDADQAEGYDINGYFNAATWIGENYIKVNGRAANMPRSLVTTSTRIPQVPGSDVTTKVFDTTRDLKVLELGIDAERKFTTDLQGKGILLFSRLERDPSSSQLDLDANGDQTRFQEEIENTVQKELISRLEFDWSGWKQHSVQFDVELALNTLENTLVFTDDTGAGPVIVDVPGGNTQVEEDRWNFLLRDTWSMGTISFEYGMNYELSTISQSGDAEQERSFNYFKPRVVLTWSPTQGRQTRLRFEKEVSQLDFRDFVTAKVFEDNSVILGNSDLRPDRTWVAEISHEYRYGSIGVIKLTAFHHWITDTLDFLPLNATVEATGNIGDARRWGGIFETTLPLEWTGLSGARIDFKLRLQDSTVIDPVTGNRRALSAQGGYRQDVFFEDENDYAVRFDFRQDIESQLVSWGFTIAERGDRPEFKADELDLFSESIDLNAFIETTRWFGLKLTFLGENLTNNDQIRDRFIYTA